ncbi:DUF4864 domain-containing protein [uncultured Nevskia sp.]|uniref:DUF4864 domain-containing protein n=1 Tax=uncultured Nevskia sp. TaxID=228950 RepID=UPI0025D2A015|nr:DUF4864 domain-containing protein [uncultured Nevskia sp.]
MALRSMLLRMIPAFMALLMLAGPAAAADEAKLKIGPDPALSPAAVVQLQLAALANVDKPVRDAGFAIVFGFASPGNRSQTGPLAHFAALIRETYPAMLNHRSSTLAPLISEGKQAIQGVELIDRSGVVHRYVFTLSKQPDGPYKDCWLTDGVVQAPEEGEPEIAI